MRFIEEVVVEQFLPTIRSMLAEALRERGLTQSEVASILGISQSAVSKYANGEVARTERVLADERVRNLVERLADGLASGDVRPVGALVECEVLIRELERGDLLAQLHAEIEPELAETGGFGVHDPEGDLRSAERVRASVRRGLRSLENTSGFAGLIPNVGSNLVECVDDPTGIDDVAGVPGRIFDVKGRAAIPGEPEFGVSEHVAGVLLAARRGGIEANAALDVRYDPAFRSRLEADHRAVEFDADSPVGKAINEALAGVENEHEAGATGVEVLYQTGGFGVEPVMYLLAADAPGTVALVRELLREG